MKKIIFLLLLFSVTVAEAQSWKEVGSGVTGVPFNTSIRILFNDSINHLLYVGGQFDHIGNTVANNIAVWNGVSWDSVGSGVNFEVNAINVYNNELYIGGHNNNKVRKWNGISWSALPAFNVGAGVKVLSVVNGELYAGGSFFLEGSNVLNGVARWTGSHWDSLGAGVKVVGNCFCNSYVDAITQYDGKLVIGGYFLTAGDTTVNNIAVWDGSSWSPLGIGVQGDTPYDGDVYDLLSDDSDLYVCGRFIIAGSDTARGIAVWNGTGWENLGIGVIPNGSSISLLRYHDTLYAVGAFVIGSWNLRRWNNTIWENYNDEEIIGGINDMTVYNNEMYIGGIMDSSIYGLQLNNIARRATLVLNATNPNCYGSCNGMANAPMIGIIPNNYLWNTSESSQTINNLCAGTYSVTVTDSTGSSSTGTVIITSPAAIIITDTITNASCQACADGMAVATITGGTTPYTYLWSNGATVSTIDSLLQGTYTVTVTDVNGCVAVDTVTVGFDVGVQSLSIINSSLSIYPNPVTSIATIEYQTTQSGKSTVTVENCLGQIIQSTEITNNKKQTIDMNNCASGMYFIKCFDGKKQTVVKIVKN